MKKILSLILVMVLIMSVFVGCSGASSSDAQGATDRDQAAQTERLMTEVNSQVGMPNIKNFYEKKMLKEIYELRDDASLITYTYTTALNGKKIFQFTSIGYGLPMSVQYSNPNKLGWVDGGEYGALNPYLMPQAEPNGLFMPEGLSATWVMKVNDDGSTEPVYMEEVITVSQSKLPRRLCEEWSLPGDYGLEIEKVEDVIDEVEDDE